MNYLEFRVEDFVLDEYFQKWILESDPMVTAFWKTWLNENPQRRQVIEEASQIVRLINFRENIPLDNEFNQAWNNVILKRETNNLSKVNHIEKFFSWRFSTYLKIAAFVSVAVFVGIGSQKEIKNHSEKSEIIPVKQITK